EKAPRRVGQAGHAHQVRGRPARARPPVRHRLLDGREGARLEARGHVRGGAEGDDRLVQGPRRLGRGDPDQGLPELLRAAVRETVGWARGPRPLVGLPTKKKTVGRGPTLPELPWPSAASSWPGARAPGSAN